jgi:hypothetical protein
MKPEIIDTKFVFTGFNPHTGQTVTQENAVVFKASDNALLDTLEFYHKKCIELGADELQIKGIEALMIRVEAWRRNYPELCKVADATPSEAGRNMAGLQGGRSPHSSPEGVV